MDAAGGLRVIDNRESPVIAVLDVGRTNIKLSVHRRDGRMLHMVSRANPVLEHGPYKHFDISAIEAWVVHSLRDLAAQFDIRSIMPCSHGSAGALVGNGSLVLPVMDYDQDVPSEVQAVHDVMGLSWADRGGATKAGATHLARQMLWQERNWPEAFSRADCLLGLPQYWAWFLSGVAASEITYLSAQSHLWNVIERRIPDAVRARGWQRLIPAMVPAWKVLGGLRPEVARATGLSPDTKIHCGVHDSSANFFRYKAAGLSDFCVVSSGSWIVSLCDELEPARVATGGLVNSFADVHGNAVGGILFMGGREFAALVAGEGPAQDDELRGALRTVLAAKTMALPSFSRFDGLFPGSGGRGRIAGPPPSGPAEREAMAVLYLALQTDVSLTALGGRSRVVIDGPLAKSALFAHVLAALRPEEETVLVSAEMHGSAVVAALLAGYDDREEAVSLPLDMVRRMTLPGLREYKEIWTELCRAMTTGKLERTRCETGE